MRTQRTGILGAGRLLFFLNEALNSVVRKRAEA